MLVVDDSPTVRELLTHLFESGGFEVAGVASDGREAVAQATKLRPDVITMDVHMPGLNGPEAIERIMEETPTPIVVVSASTPASDSGSIFEALQAGALAVADKPTGLGHPRHVHLAAELLRTARLMADVKVVRRRPSNRISVQSRASGPTVSPQQAERGRPLAIIVAASTGGPVAIQCLLQGLANAVDIPLLVVQHISQGFAAGMAAWLSETCPQPVQLAVQGERPVGGTVYLAPEDHHLLVTRNGTIALSKAPPVGGFRPSANVLFSSAAEHYGSHAIGVILTGMGDDGTDGLCSLRTAGGWTIAQDETTSVVYGMPGAAVAAGAVDQILPISAIGPALLRLLGHNANSRTAGGSPPKEASL